MMPSGILKSTNQEVIHVYVTWQRHTDPLRLRDGRDLYSQDLQRWKLSSYFFFTYVMDGSTGIVSTPDKVLLFVPGRWLREP